MLNGIVAAASTGPIDATGVVLSPWLQFAVSYAMIGVVLAALVSIGHWLLPYLANIPSLGADEHIARRVHRIQALARGFGWVEYPLIAFGSIVQISLVRAHLQPTSWFTTGLALYAALWCLQILLWHKRPVIGRVSTPRQQPVGLAVVRLFHSKTNQIYATLATQKDGRFHFMVHPGSYDLQVEKDGYRETHGVETVGPKESIRANFVLTPATPESRMSIK